MDRAGLITLEQARAARLSFDEPEPRACLQGRKRSRTWL